MKKLSHNRKEKLYRVLLQKVEAKSVKMAHFFILHPSNRNIPTATNANQTIL